MGTDQRWALWSQSTVRLPGVTHANVIGPVSVSRYTGRLHPTGADLGTGHKNNIRWMTVVTSD